MEYDINKLRLKTASQLDSGEKDFLRKNNSLLNDEDKAAYSDFLNADDGASAGDTGQGDAGEGDGSSSAGEGAPDGGQTPSGEGAGESGAGEKPTATPTYSFKSEEEARDFVKKVQQEDEEAKKRAVAAAATPEDKKYVEDNWKPKTWNEGLKKAVEIAKKEMREEDEEKRVQANFKEYDRQWNELSTEKNIPALTTIEGRKVHAQIVGIMQGFGLTTFKEGYAKWDKLTAAEKAEAAAASAAGGAGNGAAGGNGAQPTASEAASILAKAKADKIAAQKKAAAKVGGQNPGAGSMKGSASLKPTMEDIRGKSMSKLIKEGLQSA